MPQHLYPPAAIAALGAGLIAWGFTSTWQWALVGLVVLLVLAAAQPQKETRR